MRFAAIVSIAKASLLGLCIVWFATSAKAIEIKEIKTPGGITAWMVEDYTLPIVAVSFSFEGGSVQDEAGKEGTARLMAALLDEGAGDMKSEEFRAKLEESGIDLGFSASRDRFSGSLRMVREDLDQAFSMLGLALNDPRFDDDAVERMRNAIRTSIIRSKTNPPSIGRKELRKILFETHPYVRPVQGTEESVEAITREDIVAMQRKLLSSDRVKIGVVGAISEEELARYIDNVFGKLEADSPLTEIPDTKPVLGEFKHIDMPVPNTTLTAVYKGLKRSDENFFAAHLMNHILGGGTFSSRLFDEIREKRGLAYGVSSSLITSKHTSYLIASTQTRSENQAEALEVIRAEVARMAADGATMEELERAKKFVAGAYAINNLDSSAKIASVLVGLQTEELGIDYIDNRVAQIDAVTLEDVNAMAQLLLSVEPSIVVVGPKQP